MSASSEVMSLRFNQNFGKCPVNFINHRDHQSNEIGQNLGCFICGMNDGVRVFNTEPLVEKLYLSKYSSPFRIQDVL